MQIFLQMAENQISDIVRRVVSSLRNLPESSETGESSSRNSSRPNNTSVDQELGQRFQLPRVQGSSSSRPSPRGGNGRFVPYTTTGRNKRGKTKGKQPAAELIIKDVCLLPSPDWCQVPKRQVKENLVRQNFFIDAWTLDKACSEEQLRNELYQLFKDKLLGESNFEFVKSVGNTISKVKLPDGQEANARIIKHISGTGPIYIRSLSKIDNDDEDDLTCINLESEEPTTSDIRCYASRNTDSAHSNVSSSIPASNLQPSNMPDPCMSQHTSCAPSTSSSHDYCAFNAVSRTQNELTSAVWTLCDDEKQQLREMFPTCPESILTEASKECVSVDAAVDYVMNNMSEQANFDDKQSETSKVENVCISIRGVLNTLQPLPVAPMRLTVSRSSIFVDSVALFKQRNFDYRKPLRVTFEGEPAIHGGGPRREFFNIVLRDLLSPSTIPRLFKGRNSTFLRMHNTDALRANLYKVAGRIVAASVLQGGPGFPFFPKAVYTYFQNPRSDDFTVVDQDYLDALVKLDSMTKDNETTVASEVQTLLIESGFPHCLNMENRFQAMTSLCLHGVILSRKAELDQFLIGLGPLAEFIRKYPNIMEQIFVTGHAKPPTADDFLSMIEYDGVDDKIKEFFIRYLQSEDARVPNILMFATGTNAIPPMGFSPSVITVLQNTSVFPNANTCPLELELPGGVNSYEEFKQNMDSALKFQEVGFGIV